MNANRPRFAGSNSDRLIRIESKLHRLMLSLNMDGDGNPAGGIVLDRITTDNLVSMLDRYLDLMDDHNIDKGYAATEALYNRLLTLRDKRWPTNQTY